MKCRVLSTRWADVDVGLCRKELGCLQRFQVVGGLPRFWESWTLSRPSAGKTDVQPTLVDTIIDREDSITHNTMTDACICVKQVLGAQFRPRPPSTDIEVGHGSLESAVYEGNGADEAPNLPRTALALSQKNS